MKRLAILTIALASNIAVGATTVTVNGYGSDRESAKQDALNTAVTNVCGKAVLSNREHFNNNTTHDGMSVYSSCRVKKFEILDTIDGGLRVRVTVVDNKSSTRLFSESNSRLEFNGDEVRSQIDSLKREQKQGDILIDEIFRDYPYHAYNLKSEMKPYITNDEKRDIYLMVPFEVTWNYNFIVAMNETFSQIKTKRGFGVISVSAKNPDNLVLGKKDNYYINDWTRFNYIKSKFMYDNELRLKVRARDNKGRDALSLCYNPEYKAGGIFYSIGISDELTIFGNDRNQGTIKIKLTIPAEVIYDISVDVVAQRDCKL